MQQQYPKNQNLQKRKNGLNLPIIRFFRHQQGHQKLHTKKLYYF
jgi:hypothetical protein